MNLVREYNVLLCSLFFHPLLSFITKFLFFFVSAKRMEGVNLACLLLPAYLFFIVRNIIGTENKTENLVIDMHSVNTIYMAHLPNTYCVQIANVFDCLLLALYFSF